MHLVICQRHGGYENITESKTLNRPSLTKIEDGVLQPYNEFKRPYKINIFTLKQRSIDKRAAHHKPSNVLIIGQMGGGVAPHTSNYLRFF